MTTFWWVRHGPTHEKAFVGWRDVPADLSDTAQIERLNSYLPKNAVLISSDLSRAIATADTLNTGRQRLAHAPDLRELNFGDWDGKPFDEVAKTHPDLSRTYWENPGDVAPPNGESWNFAANRVSSCVKTLHDTYPDRDVIVVAHIGIILTQLGLAQNTMPSKTIAQKIDNFSVTRITLGPQISVGPINHLP